MAKWEEAPEVENAPSAKVSTVPKWTEAPEEPEEEGVVKPAAETLATLASGAVAQPLAGLAGIGASFIPGAKAADVVEKVQNTLTYAPKTARANKALSAIAYPFEKLAQGASYLGEKLGGEFGGMAGQVIGEAAPMFLPIKGLKAGRASPEIQALRARSQAAREAGYKVPPAMAGDTSTIGNVAGGIGGKIKTQQEASLANQEITNNLVKKDLGVPEDTQLSPEVLARLRREAGAGYADIKNLPGKFRATDEYIDSLHAIGSEVVELSKKFPDIASHKKIRKLITSLAQPEISPKDAVNLIKQLRADSKINYRSDKPANVQLADAQYKASGLLEDMIESNLQGLGKPELLDRFRAARTQLAKIHNIDKIYNETTGTVPARRLGALLDKNTPLTGGMRTAAEFGRSFEKAAQTPEMIGGVPPVSPLDLAVGAGLGVMGGLSMGQYGSLAAMVPALRPASRALVLSDMYQKGLPKAVKGPLSAIKETSPFLLQSAGESR
jgi:hypothetical protein